MKKILLVLMAMLFIFSCGSKEQAAGKTEDKPAESGEKTYTIGVSLLTQQHPFYLSLKDAIEKEAAAQNVKLNVSIANQDLNKQISDIEDFITKKVDAIIISPVDSKGVLAAVKKAEAANIPVITVDVPAIGVDVAAHVATDNYTGGKIAGEEMARLLNGKGEVAIIEYPTVDSVVQRIEGFKEVIANYPDIKIVAVQAGITRPEALTAAQNMIQAYKNLGGIFGFGDDAALAAVAAVKSAGKEDQIKVIGFDGMQEARDAVTKEKSFVAVITQYPGDMGKIAVDTTLKILKGEQVEKNIPVTPGIFTKEGEKK